MQLVLVLLLDQILDPLQSKSTPLEVSLQTSFPLDDNERERKKENCREKEEEIKFT